MSRTYQKVNGVWQFVDSSRPANPYFNNLEEEQEFFRTAYAEGIIRDGDKITYEHFGTVKTGYAHLYDPYAAEGRGYHDIITFTYQHDKEEKWYDIWNMGGNCFEEHVIKRLEIERASNTNTIYQTGDVVQHEGRYYMVRLQIDDEVLIRRITQHGLGTKYHDLTLPVSKVGPAIPNARRCLRCDDFFFGTDECPHKNCGKGSFKNPGTGYLRQTHYTKELVTA